MKRILLLAVVAMMLTVMMVAMAASPALATRNCSIEGDTITCHGGAGDRGGGFGGRISANTSLTEFEESGGSGQPGGGIGERCVRDASTGTDCAGKGNTGEPDWAGS